jgi:hypothetical protein
MFPAHTVSSDPLDVIRTEECYGQRIAAARRDFEDFEEFERVLAEIEARFRLLFNENERLREALCAAKKT